MVITVTTYFQTTVARCFNQYLAVLRLSFIITGVMLTVESYLCGIINIIIILPTNVVNFS